MSRRQWFTCVSLLTVLIQVLHFPAWGMEHYSDSLQSETGKAIGGASVAVYKSGTLTLATIYSDNGITPKANPFLTNVFDGTYDFYAANNVYDIVFRHPEYTFDDLHTKRITLFDPTEFSGDISYGTAFPTDPVLNDLFVLTSDVAAGTCAQGGGIEVSLCRWDGVTWRPLGGGGAVDGFINGTNKQVTWATSFANAFQVLNGSNTGTAIYTDATLGPQWICVVAGVQNACNYVRQLASGKYYEIQDSGGSKMIRFDPSQSTANLKYSLGTGHKILKSVYWDAGAINTDGTNCTPATEQALNGSEKTWALSCADSNSSKMSGKVKMPGNYDGGTVQFTLSLTHGTTESITFAGAFSARCRGLGDTIDGTYGSAQTANVGITTAFKPVETTTLAVTPDGTCAAGKFLMWRYVVDAANFSTNAANSKVLGVLMTYSTNSLSH